MWVYLGVHMETVIHFYGTLITPRAVYGRWMYITIRLSGLSDMHAVHSDMLWETRVLTLLHNWMRVSDDCITRVSYIIVCPL